MNQPIKLPWPDVEIDPASVQSLTVAEDGVRIVIHGQDGEETQIETFWTPEIDLLIEAIRVEGAAPVQT
jgi:hypothetical protein